MTVSASSVVSLTSYFDAASGAPLQASLYFYRAGTLDPITVYVDSGLSVPHPIPVLTTGYGRVPPVWVGEVADPGYRVRSFDQYSQLIEDLDNIPGPTVAAGGGGGGGTINPGDPSLYATGDLIFAMSNAQPRAGAVLANGTSVGKTGSTFANGRANDDCLNLFKWLWGQDLYGLLPVNPSRGSTAQGDWDAGKAIATPDFRCRLVMGMDAMGATTTNRLAGVPMAGGTPEKLGSYGGEATHKLLTAEMAAHNHALTDPGHTHTGSIPAHTHGASGYSDSIGSHSHNVTTYPENASHTHSIPCAGTTIPLPIGSPSGAVVPTSSGNQTGTESAAHAHTGYTDAQGVHQHNLTITVAQQPSLAVTNINAPTGITVSPIGGDGVHNTTPLFLAVTVYVKL